MDNFLKRTANRDQYLVSLFTIAGVSALCLATRDYIDYRMVGYLLLVAVSLLAALLRIKPVLLAALLSAVILDFFFIKPYYNLHIHNAEDALLLLMYFVIALVNGVLTYKIRTAEQLARQRETKWNTMKLYNTLLDSLSHELRTPISTIMGAVGTLQEKNDGLTLRNEEQLLAEMEKAALRLNHQVENLLNMSRLESGYIQPKSDWCDIGELTYNVVNNLKEELSGHKVTVEKSGYLPLFRLDYGLTEQVLYNLLFNAAQYSGAGASIHINLEFRPEVDYEPHDGLQYTCSIVVSDDGSGFPNTEIGNAFDKFYRMRHAKTGGTGLGLSIVRGFVEAQDGTVTVQNRDEGGAEFRILFPAPVMHTKSIGNE
jgi:two-component system sensor histidine kinase KdpD